MWLVVRYQPTTLFSLRYSLATTTGAKSLLVPSPYTIKMALVVAAIRWQGVEFAKEVFPILRDLSPIRIRPSEHAIVNRCFLKYQKLREDKTAKSKRGEDYEPPVGFQSTVGFHEYVHLQGELSIALPVLDEVQSRHLLQLAVRVNYFGKRGSFVQYAGFEHIQDLPQFFSVSLSAAAEQSGILQPLDDMAPTLTFDQVDVTSDIRMVSGDRPSSPVLLPYRVNKTASTYAAYILLEERK
jgi:hypothetical protein